MFGQFGEIESIKLIPAQENQPTQRAFICFKSPDAAATARANLHQSQTVEGKQLYVTNYELPEIRKKQQADAKDKADFINLKRQTAGPMDTSTLQKPETIKLIEQIVLLVQRQMGGARFPNQGGAYNSFPNNRGQMGNNGMRPNNRPPYHNNNGQVPRGPRPTSQGPYVNAQPGYPAPQPLIQPPPQPLNVAPAQVVIKDSQGPLRSTDPYIDAYNIKGFSVIPAVLPGNPNLKQFVGDCIYEVVERFVGDEKAPKITGMLIDLPHEEIKAYLYDFTKLYQKIQEAQMLLNQINAQQAQ